MTHGILRLTGAVTALIISLSGTAIAASQYDAPLELCATAIQEKLSIAPENYRQSIDRVSSLGSKYKFTLNVYQTTEDGDKKKFKFYCETKGGEVTALEDKTK